jgi:hypothetical protein
MKCIEMGLNTSPTWEKEEEVIARLTANGNQEMLEDWIKSNEHSKGLRDAIIEEVEANGECELNWSCTGETRFNIHACQWADAMPQYRFEIGRYSCKVYKD